jgi:hypothetical protein
MYAETTKLQSLHLPKSAPWLEAFMREYLTIPGSKHKDQIDALSQFFNWRTQKEASSFFSADFGHAEESRHGAVLQAPSPEELFWRLRR